jgi:hypothetical protein
LSLWTMFASSSMGGCGGELGIEDGEVAEIPTETIEVIEDDASEANLLLNLSGREVGDRSGIDGVCASVGVGYAVGGEAVGTSFEDAIEAGLVADFFRRHEAEYGALLGSGPNGSSEGAAIAMPIDFGGEAALWSAWM